MLNSDSQEQEPFGDARLGFNILMLIVETYAFAVEVLLHHRFGCRAFGAQAFGVLLLIPCHALACENYDVGWLLAYWWMFLSLCMLHRIGMGIRHFRGTLRDEHSRYQGWPWLMHLSPNWSEAKVKRVVEPLLMGAIAVLLVGRDPAVASFLGVAAFCLFVKHGASAARNQEQELDLNDQVLEMQAQGERFRRIRR